MIILVINAGSSSLKYKVIDISKKKVLLNENIEKIGSKGSFSSHEDAIQYIFQKLTKSGYTIDAIGHRVVHGGDFFSQSVKIDAKVIEKIKKCSILAPLHNPANLSGILACKKFFPKIPQVAVFDTAFHQSMKEENYLYPLPYDFYTKYKIRRYGFHGISHKYVYKKSRAKKGEKVITCHIGNGASITAIQDGKVLETSMGMTPLEGLMMGTRCGNIDPAIIFYLIIQKKINPVQVQEILEKKSGLLGISGISWDMRDILFEVKKGNPRAQLAFKMYLNSIIKYIGAYTSLMNGVDTIILTGGIMERSPFIRKLLIKKLSWLGIKIDNQKNQSNEKEIVISTRDSKVQVKVIPTDEEAEIAYETAFVLKGL